jgi:hydroxymethylglutaryl-CoA lyase
VTGLPERICITEVGLRDGLQNESAHVPTDTKERLGRGLAAAGLPRLEVGAFVRADMVPQMADTAELCRRLADLSSTELCVIAPNVRGARDAVTAGVAEVRLFLSAAEGHSRSNTGRSVEEGARAVIAAAEVLRDSGTPMSVAVATAFVCPFDGPVAADTVAGLVARLSSEGIDRVTLADTIGRAHPGQIRDALHAVHDRCPSVSVGLHLHDTYGTGIANAWVAMEEGVTDFDSSLGGTGGCPFAPGAAGNIATEDLVFLCNEAGVDTGVRLDAVNELAAGLPSLLGHPVDSRQSRVLAGARR